MRALRVRRGELSGAMNEAARLRSEPARYIEAQAKYLRSLDAFAAGLEDPWVDYDIAREYTSLGLFALMRANDPGAAVRFLEKAAKGGEAVGAVAFADTLEQGVNDKPGAIRAYQAALARATKPSGPISPFGGPGYPLEEFAEAWFTAEIEYLRTGKPFRGRVSELAIQGFWSFIMSSSSNTSTYGQVLSTAVISTPAYGSYGLGNTLSTRAEWPDVAEMYRKASRPESASWLAQFPKSRMSFIVTMREVSALGDPAAILSRLARDDPSGYWTTILLGTVAYHETYDRDGALDDQVAKLLPGMAAPGNPNPLAVAARRYTQSRGLRVAELK